jgi:hypothetical protein
MHMHSIRKFFALLLLLQSPAESSATEPLGRLFFSAAERVQMDRRQQEDRPALPPPSLDGIITRSAGTPTLFLDGKAVSANPAQIHMHQGKASVTGADGRVHRLRVGDPPSESPAR